MATITAYLVPDYANSITVSGAQGTMATTASSGAITTGKRRIVHISALNIGATTSRCAVRYTLGLSTGTTAPTPTASSPFFLGDEGWTIDLGDLYDQINLANLAADNGANTLAYSVSLMSKF